MASPAAPPIESANLSAESFCFLAASSADLAMPANAFSISFPFDLALDAVSLKATLAVVDQFLNLVAASSALAPISVPQRCVR